MIRSRRVFVASLTVLLALVASGVMAAVVPGVTNGTPAAIGGSGRTQVYLLGSQGGQQGTQLTGANVRAGTSALIVVDGVGYMLDAGVGALLRLNEAGFDPNIVRHVFVTHHARCDSHGGCPRHGRHAGDRERDPGEPWLDADRRLPVRDP
jgi:hypothetical protein